MQIFTQMAASLSNPAASKKSFPRTTFWASSVSISLNLRLNQFTQLSLQPSVGCSHVRAWQYFVESIRRPEAFLTDSCESTNNESNECVQSIPAYMGFSADRRLRGKFFVRTNNVSPFGRNFPIWSSDTSDAEAFQYLLTPTHPQPLVVLNKNHKKHKMVFEAFVLDWGQKKEAKIHFCYATWLNISKFRELCVEPFADLFCLLELRIQDTAEA